jgi:hypothetical protein
VKFSPKVTTTIAFQEHDGTFSSFSDYELSQQMPLKHGNAMA